MFKELQLNGAGKQTELMQRIATMQMEFEKKEREFRAVEKKMKDSEDLQRIKLDSLSNELEDKKAFISKL